MWKENLYQPVEVLTRRHTKFPIDEHQHSFYEMVYVREGSGTFSVREEGCPIRQCRYRARSLFLIPPDTTHRFTITTCSEYVFIRFTPQYAADYLGRRIEQALGAPAEQCVVVLRPEDARTADLLFGFIEAESAAPRECSNPLIQAWLNSILLLVAGHRLQEIDRQLPLSDPHPDKALYMLQYIQQQIHHPERLTCEALGEKFHLAPSYVGPYFKRHFHEELRSYIRRNRIRAAEHLLAESPLTVKEIAARLGFTDAGYLVKSFRAFHTMTPLEFRRRNRPGTPSQSDERLPRTETSVPTAAASTDPDSPDRKTSDPA